MLEKLFTILDYKYFCYICDSVNVVLYRDKSITCANHDDKLNVDMSNFIQIRLAVFA